MKLRDARGETDRGVTRGITDEERGRPAASAPAVTADGADLADLLDPEIFAEFLSRQSEALAEIESLGLALEEGRVPEDTTDVMRFFHTLKGESALLGLEEMSRLAHATEDMLTSEPIAHCGERLLAVKDWLDLEFSRRDGRGGEPGPLDAMLALLAGDVSAPSGDETPAPAISGDVGWADVGLDEELFAQDVREGDVDLLQDFIAESGEHLDEAEVQLLVLETNPTDVDALNAVFRAFHTIKGVAGFVDMSHVQELAHKAENLLDRARRGELVLADGALDLVFKSVDMLKRLGEDVVAALAADGRLRRREALPGLMDRLIRAADGDAAPSPPVPPAEGERTSGFIPLRKPPRERRVPDPPPPPVPSSVKDEAPPPPPAPAGQTVAKVQRKEAVRVDADRLDLLVETIGELVIAEAMVGQSGDLRRGASVETARNLDHLGKICRELQEIGMSLRMIPVRPIFQKMNRLVRDLSRKTGRSVEFGMSGEETELDKSVVDKIGDPLVHMIRNAVDHGIEADPAARRAAGKPETGRIELRAYHEGGNIVIEVGDDGRGLDRDAILAKAVARGLVKEGQTLPDREVFALIFEPGFSTAAQVTDVSGRGVGMDVVRRNIDELRGSVEIESFAGEGSIFRFRLPLTLAIIDGMVIRVGRENYIVPTLSVVRLVRPAAEDIATVRGEGEMMRFEDGLVPLHRLDRLFDVPDAAGDLSEAVVVVVENEGRRVGLVADDLVGQQQIVIKSLGEKVQGTPGIAGGAIMSDGNVALILDAAGLVKAPRGGDAAAGRIRAAE